MMHERFKYHHHSWSRNTTTLILWLIIHVVLVVTEVVTSSVSSSSTTHHHQQQLNNLSSNHSIIAFGDSLTHGLYVGSKETSLSSRSTRIGGGNIMGYHSYVINLRKLINNKSISVLEYGRNTDDTHMMIPRLQKILQQYTMLPSSQSLPLFVIILAGTISVTVMICYHHHAYSLSVWIRR